MITIVKDVVSVMKDSLSIFSGLFSKCKLKKTPSDEKLFQPQFPLPFSDVKSKIFSVDNDMASLKNCIRDDAENKSKAEIYFSNYDVAIQLVITKEGVKIKSSYTISFVNPYGVSYRFRRKPMVREGLQYESYRFTDVRFQNKNRDDLIRMYDSSEQAPHPRYRFKTGIELYLPENLTESVLHYSAEYKTESAQFFNTFQFYNFCKHLSVDVTLAGEGAEEYELQWDVFLHSNTSNRRATRNVACNEPQHVHFSVGDWIFPGNGYVITINKKHDASS